MLVFQIKHKLEVCFNEQDRNSTDVLVVENPTMIRESTCQLLFNVNISHLNDIYKSIRTFLNKKKNSGT